jgi:Xaa-Pro aminopeptidase
MVSITNSTPDLKTAVAKRLEALREHMRQHQVDAYLVPSTDEHINEYLPENRQRRAWVSGFTGSAGDFLLTLEGAWLFVDSRYHEQADHEVDGSLIEICKLGLEGQPTLSEKINTLTEAREGFRLGVDPFTLSVQQTQTLEKTLKSNMAQLISIPQNLVDVIWENQPPTPNAEVFALPDSIAGENVSRKLEALRQRMTVLKTDVLPLTKLDQIAWLFNLRGQDIPYNPVFIAYAIITPKDAWLFTNCDRIQPEALASLPREVQCLPYAAYVETLSQLAQSGTVLIDPRHTTLGTLNVIQQSAAKYKEAEHPVELLKAVKNPTELENMRLANLKASRGKIRAWYWLEQQLESRQRVTEASFKDAIERFYAQEEGFWGLSFNTISGAGANSSIVHYGTPSPDKALEPGELFLIDSGCQFYGGTTDDTRTMLIGNTADELQKLRYTEVLKAHINCAMQKFPKGTEGTRLDGITRATLWQHGLDYGHGTGHGVGAFLNVHEGPNGIHKLASKALEPGMITSIEPGYYEPGWGGIRLENLYCVIDLGNNQYGFESLTYIPFDKRLIDFNRLNPEQLQWLRDYYRAIQEKIAPSLSADEAAWLTSVCAI